VKKYFLLMMLMVGGSGSVLGQHNNIGMQIIKHGGAAGGSTYAPPRPWYITQDENVLTLPSLVDDYTIELHDRNNVVVYYTYIPAGTTQVVLPSTLSGDFEIRLVADTYYYRGYIIL